MDDNSGDVFERSVEKFFVVVESNLAIGSVASASFKTPSILEFQVPFTGSQVFIQISFNLTFRLEQVDT